MEQDDSGDDYGFPGDPLLPDDAEHGMSDHRALSTPAPAQPSEVEQIIGMAQFLSDRLDDLEWSDDDLAATCRDFMGHVDPAHSRLKTALAALANPHPTIGEKGE